MKIKVGQLRQLIREVKLSPSLKNNKRLDNAMSDQDISTLVDRLDGAFEQALTLDLIIRNFDSHYDPQTREFSDKAYEAIKAQVARAKQKVNANVRKSIESGWSDGHDSEAPPASGVRNSKPPPAKAA